MKKQTEDAEPNVEIFGDRTYRHRDSGSVVWGVMLLSGGIMLLLNTMGMVPWNVWEYIWQFWPVIFIFMGIQVILGNGALASVVLFAASVIVFGLVGIAALDHAGSPLADQIHLPSVLNDWLLYIRRMKP